MKAINRKGKDPKGRLNASRTALEIPTSVESSRDFCLKTEWNMLQVICVEVLNLFSFQLIAFGNQSYLNWSGLCLKNLLNLGTIGSLHQLSKPDLLLDCRYCLYE